MSNIIFNRKRDPGSQLIPGHLAFDPFPIARKFVLLLIPLCSVLIVPASHAQLWSGILSPTYGSGACTLTPSPEAAARCAIDWTQAGIPGGVPSDGPSWSQSGSTIQASAYGNG